MISRTEGLIHPFRGTTSLAARISAPQPNTKPATKGRLTAPPPSPASQRRITVAYKHRHLGHIPPPTEPGMRECAETDL